MAESSIVRTKSYESFDLFKFITSFIVMLVHTNPLGESHFHMMHPWCRIVIPVFFMISSFLFFGKYDGLPEEEKNGYLLKFVKRDLILYIFWFIIFLPFTIIYRDYLHKGFTFFIGSIFLGSTYPASWYLIALAISIIFVAKLDKGIGKKLFLLQASCFICCASVNSPGAHWQTGPVFCRSCTTHQRSVMPTPFLSA